MSYDLNIPFDHVTYRSGQLLTARDLQDDWQRDARLRRLHVRYLHETWGIALGFEVSQVVDGKEVQSEGNAVAVGPGYAVDAWGRDLLLAENVRIAAPALRGQATFVLTVRYQEDAAFRERPDLRGLCLSGGLDPRQERPVFAWRRPDEVRFGPEVPLLQVVVKNEVIQGELDYRVRRYAQPLVRPHSGWETTEPGRTGWRAWKDGNGKPLGLEVEVDTSEAGFRHTPYYFAMLQGDFSRRIDEPSTPWSTEAEPTFFLDHFGFITDPAPAHFRYRLIHNELFPFGNTTFETQAEEREWTIFWLGLEPVTGCEPVFDVADLFGLAGFPVHLLTSFMRHRSEA